ncbi:hypothetical protein [Methanococcoides methylutens]|nr:hypothetical protein [Methanococcoides methylutens]
MTAIQTHNAVLKYAELEDIKARLKLLEAACGDISIVEIIKLSHSRHH